jgi:hypothetical protein
VRFFVRDTQKMMALIEEGDPPAWQESPKDDQTRLLLQGTHEKQKSGLPKCSMTISTKSYST